MTLTLHQHPFAAYCWKATAALYERGVPFESHLVADAADRATLSALWPMASIPVLVDDERGLTLPESTVIVEYLDGLGDAPPLLPTDPRALLKARLWDRIIDGHVATPMQKIVLDSIRDATDKDPAGVADARAELDRAYALIEAHLASVPHEWLAGDDFSLADCAALPALFYARVVHRWDEPALPHLTAYYAALTARPACARVIDEARPFRNVFPLPWPDWVD